MRGCVLLLMNSDSFTSQIDVIGGCRWHLAVLNET